MLKTDSVIKLLKKNKEPMSFEDIWMEVREETLASLSETGEISKEREIEIKSSLYTSFLEDQSLIMVEGHKWDLKKFYSFNEIMSIEKTRLTEEIELNLEASDDTKELNFELSPKTIK